MKYIFEVWDDSVMGEEKPIRTHEFDSLDETRKYAQKTITEDEERGLDYGYFIVDSEDSDISYDIWEEQDI